MYYVNVSEILVTIGSIGLILTVIQEFLKKYLKK